MNMRNNMDLERRLDEILVEEVSDKLPHLAAMLMSKKSEWPYKDKIDQQQLEQFILGLARFDPTGDRGQYVPYIVRLLTNKRPAIANRNPDDPLPAHEPVLRIGPGQDEDGPRILEALTYFDNNYKSANWKLPRDITQIKDWKILERMAVKAAKEGDDQQSKRQIDKERRRGAEKVFEITLPNREESYFYVYKITEPEAAVTYGMGSRWCTTSLSEFRDGYSYSRSVEQGPDGQILWSVPAWHPNAGQKRPLENMEIGSHRGYAITATDYLTTGPLYIIFRRNKTDNSGVGKGYQLMQITEDGTQIMDIGDDPLVRCSPATDWMFGHWQQAPGAPLQAIKRARANCGDYRGRPPV